eukprot:scaffold1591_cov109-Isochrysis_galbana.AAC.10
MANPKLEFPPGASPYSATAPCAPPVSPPSFLPSRPEIQPCLAGESQPCLHGGGPYSAHTEGVEHACVAPVSSTHPRNACSVYSQGARHTAPPHASTEKTAPAVQTVGCGGGGDEGAPLGAGAVNGLGLAGRARGVKRAKPGGSGVGFVFGRGEGEVCHRRGGSGPAERGAVVQADHSHPVTAAASHGLNGGGQVWRAHHQPD